MKTPQTISNTHVSLSQQPIPHRPVRHGKGYLWLVAVLISSGLGQDTGHAQVFMYNTVSSIYTQDFNQDLPSAAVTNPWNNGVTFPNWYAQHSLAPLNVTQYRITFGQSTGINVYQWRNGPTATNGALGAIPVNATGDIHFGVAFQNNTGIDLTSFTLGYIGQQWRITTSGPTTLTVSYQFGNLMGDLLSGTWTPIPSLTFTSPNSNAASNTNVDGTLPANSQIFTPVTVTDNWVAGTQLWIRFTVENSPGFSQGLAIDDFVFSAIPEPQLPVLLALLAVIFFATMRKLRLSNSAK